MTDDEPALARALAERRHLMSLAFRMLGTIAEAEDAVQETYVRWWRTGRAEREAVQAPHFWLQRVTSRICLDLLGSARARREEYVGPWLPEPLPSQVFARPAPDPADRVTLDDSVSSALLVVLETMTPAERVAFGASGLPDGPDARLPARHARVGRTQVRRRRRAVRSRTERPPGPSPAPGSRPRRRAA